MECVVRNRMSCALAEIKLYRKFQTKRKLKIKRLSQVSGSSILFVKQKQK